MNNFKNLTEQEQGLILMALTQQKNKISARHQEYLEIDPEYDGPMVGQAIYDRTVALIKKLENNSRKVAR